MVVADADVAAGRAKGVPRDVEPARTGQQLVGILAALKEDDEAAELLGVAGTDVGCLTQQVLRVADTAHTAVDLSVAESAVDQDGTYLLACRLQQHVTTVGEVGHMLHGGQVAGVLFEIQKLCQHEVWRESRVIELFCHGTQCVRVKA